MPEDPITGEADDFGFTANLKTLRPYFVRHWRKGLIGCVLILLNSLLSFPQPHITRYIVGNVVRFAGGSGLLFYLEWRLAVIAVLFFPGIVLYMRYFSSQLHVLIHQSMEQEAKAASGFQESLASTSLIKTFSSKGRTVGQLM